MTKRPLPSVSARRLSPDELRWMAGFRMLLRQFQSFGEQASATVGLTSVQYQALLAIETRQGDLPLTVKRLAQLLLIKHNSAVGLVDRIAQLGFAVRRRSESDGRSVVIELTPHGRLAMNRIAAGHRRELQDLAVDMGRYVRHFSKPTGNPPAGKPPSSTEH